MVCLRKNIKLATFEAYFEFLSFDQNLSLNLKSMEQSIVKCTNFTTGKCIVQDWYKPQKMCIVGKI